MDNNKGGIKSGKNAMKFNIALIPEGREVTHAFIQLASQLRDEYGLKTMYLLREEGGNSIPHLSVSQLMLQDRLLLKITEQNEERSLLGLVWQYTVAAWQEILQESASQRLAFVLSREIHIKKDLTGVFAGTSWVELVLDS